MEHIFFLFVIVTNGLLSLSHLTAHPCRPSIYLRQVIILAKHLYLKKMFNRLVIQLQGMEKWSIQLLMSKSSHASMFDDCRKKNKQQMQIKLKKMQLKKLAQSFTL